MKAQKQWRCHSLSSKKDTSFLICIPRETAQELVVCKARFLLAQPLLFGQKRQGVISFIVTGYEITDPLPEPYRVAVGLILTAAVEKGIIASFKIKEIDDEAIRVTVVFDVPVNKKFAKNMIETTLKVLNAFRGPAEELLIAILEQLNLESENYVFHDSVWLTEQQALYLELGVNNMLQDQSEMFQINVEDLF